MEKEQWQAMGISGPLTVPVGHAIVLHPDAITIIARTGLGGLCTSPSPPALPILPSLSTPEQPAPPTS